ncbi:MAG: DUF4922 domain-containing protein [Paludibacteraceae bacterium]|nr:DUF4922 domain-containing protein [Paludibacteraceae bacterium]
MSPLAAKIESMYDLELTPGGRAAFQYGLLRDVRRKDLPVGDFPAVLFFNPGRVHSVMADVSRETLAHRQCFLCPEGLEDKQQTYIMGRDADCYGEPFEHQYALRVNPFPIFAPHFTLSSAQHEPQQIRGHYEDMLRFTTALPEYTIFYNGARCGASAPDHMHFQAVRTGNLPMQVYVDQHRRLPDFCPSARWIHADSIEEMSRQFFALVDEFALKTQPPTYPQALPPRPDAADFNIISWWSGQYNTIVLFRRQSRPACFFAEREEERILISPGAVEMCGVAIVSNEASFERLTADKLYEIINEVSITI